MRFNCYMVKSQKDLAYLRDLYIDENWTRRFTDLFDKHVGFKNGEKILYVNAGTGNHVFALRERIKKDTAIFATCENEEVLTIARDKAAAVRADIDFSMKRFEDNKFDAVVADASFVRPEHLEQLLGDSVRVTRPGGNTALMIVSAGSFGEIFSLLWEVLFNEDLGEHGAAAEQRITELPTLTNVEEMAARAGLENIHTHTANEFFDYDNGAAFINSPLVADFLLPVWLRTLNESEKERVTEQLARLIDDEDGNLSFRFSVKVTLLTGDKA